MHPFLAAIIGAKQKSENPATEAYLSGDFANCLEALSSEEGVLA